MKQVTKRLLRPNIIACAFLFTCYFVAAYLFPNRTLLETLRVFEIAVASAVVIAYGREALRVFFGERPDNVGQLTLGIELSWITDVVAGLWILLWRVAGQPAWMINNDLFGMFIFAKIIAATLHVTAPGAIEGRVPKKNMIALGIVAGIGIATIVAIATFHPNLEDVLGMIKPYVAEPNSDTYYTTPMHP